MEFEIRKAGLQDVELLTIMRLEMRRERETASLSIPETEFEQITLNYFRTALADPDFVSCLAIAGTEAAACSGLVIHRHAPSYSNLTGRTGYIFNMYTRPAWRHNGLAVRLLDAVILEAQRRGCSKIGLNASPAGRGVYLKYGFREIGGEMELDLSRRL